MAITKFGKAYPINATAIAPCPIAVFLLIAPIIPSGIPVTRPKGIHQITSLPVILNARQYIDVTSSPPRAKLLPALPRKKSSRR